MNDRTLLEAAAASAGLHFHGHRENINFFAAWVSKSGCTDDWFSWNPLTDDADALRLAVKLGILGTPPHVLDFVAAMGDADPYAATRRAIVRAAAAMGASEKRTA